MAAKKLSPNVGANVSDGAIGASSNTLLNITVRRQRMDKILKISVVTIALVAFIVSSAMATKPGNKVNPNGFPSGFHYNLNIHAKNESFVCDYARDEYGQITTGNVINVPDYLTGAEIKMLSGKGKKAEQFTDLAVTDPCAGFPTNKNLTDKPYAMLQLPKNELGYNVYARPLGKPSKDEVKREIILKPELGLVLMEETDAEGNLILDEYGEPVTTDLIYLGLVDDSGFKTETMKRERTKGRSIAVPITGLFLWSGDVCYFDSTDYCDGDCYTRDVCCATEIEEVVGEVTVLRYLNCEDPVPDPFYQDMITCREVDIDSGEIPLSLITVDCKTYTDYWVFNIADLVEYLWNVDSNNVKQFNVRFYPRSEY
jgi:hypothetical protein